MQKSRIAELKQRVSLKDYVSKRVRLENRGGEYWGCCPFHNEKSPSFSVKQKPDGEVFYCQGCGKGGDIIRFVEYSSGCTTKEAIKKLAQEFGLDEKAATEVKQADPNWQEGYDQVAATFENVAEEQPKKTYAFDQWKRFEDALQSNQPALDYLKNKRGLDADTARNLHIGFTQVWKSGLAEKHLALRDKGWLMFPRIADGRIVACKARSLVEKVFTQWAGMEPKALFNIETINGLEPVFVTEGEYDAAILEMAGFRAVSIPSASNHKMTPDTKNRLKQAEAIFLAGDNDGKVGNDAMKQIARELNPGAYILLWPNAKDANAFFLDVCNRDLKLFETRVRDLMDMARTTPVEGFRSVSAQLRAPDADYDAKNDVSRLHFPWSSVDDMNYSPAGSVVVIYSTYSGTGKSVLVTQIAVHEAKRGETVVAYTPELAREQYLALLAAQNLGPKLEGGLNRIRVTTEQRHLTADILDATYYDKSLLGDSIPSFYNYRKVEGPINFYSGYKLPVSETSEVLDFIEYTVRVTGATRFIIDTLHRIAKSDEGNQTQVESMVIKRLEEIGLKYGTTFILIGQSNKEAENIKELRKDEYGVLRGSRELIDVAYGIYLVHRKRSPRAAETGTGPEDLLLPEAELLLRKDRGKGPGPSYVPMMYKKDTSRFVLADRRPEPDGSLASASGGDELSPI